MPTTDVMDDNNNIALLTSVVGIFTFKKQLDGSLDKSAVLCNLRVCIPPQLFHLNAKHVPGSTSTEANNNARMANTIKQSRLLKRRYAAKIGLP